MRQTIKFLKVISEKNRFEILRFLRKRERCVCEIWRRLNLPQNLISHHLKALKNFNLISSRQEGAKVFYRLNQKVVSNHLELLNRIFKLEEKK